MKSLLKHFFAERILKDIDSCQWRTRDLPFKNLRDEIMSPSRKANFKRAFNVRFPFKSHHLEKKMLILRGSRFSPLNLRFSRNRSREVKEVNKRILPEAANAKKKARKMYAKWCIIMRGVEMPRGVRARRSTDPPAPRNSQSASLSIRDFSHSPETSVSVSITRFHFLHFTYQA